MSLEKVENLIAHLSRAEKAQVLQWVARDLGDAFAGIERVSGVAGEEAYIVRARVPVWELVQKRRQGATEAEILRAYPALRAEDLANAWAYARQHQEEIDRQIKENTSDRLWVWGSPRHLIDRSEDVTKWELNQQIDFFYAVTDGFYLEVANKVINGWQDDDGTHHIYASQHGRNINHIPASGLAVLQIVAGYFEVIGRFKFGIKDLEDGQRMGYERFIRGCVDVFSRLENSDALQKIYVLRNSLLHAGDIRAWINLSQRATLPVAYDQDNEIVYINPHKFVPALQDHLVNYVEELLDERNEQLRDLFIDAFNERYKRSA